VTTTAVVTRRAGFTLTLHSPGHRFLEVRPTAGWLERPWPEDVIVLDLESSSVTADALATLRDGGRGQPVVVVANDTDGWDSLIADHPDLFLVSVPVVPAALIATVERAARLSHAAPKAHTGPAPAAEVRAQTPEPEPAVAPDQGPAAADRPVQSSLDTQPSPTAARAPDGLPGPRTRLAVDSPAEPAPPGVTVVRDDPVALVRALRPLVGRLSRVAEVAELVRKRVVTAVPCEASAVLVPDGDVWRVAAGAALRPLEERLQIDAAHWLVSEIVGSGHGILICDTDIARTKLSGSPLAAWPNLLALPVAEVAGVVLLARQVKPFSREDVTKAKQAIGPAGLQLSEAVDVRDLARALAPFLDAAD
jgi:hypothetical protein